MPFPFILGPLAAAAAAAYGIKKGFDAHETNSRAEDINMNAKKALGIQQNYLNKARLDAQGQLKLVGKKKIYVLQYDIKPFVESYGKIKNIKFKDSTGLEELSHFTITEGELQELSQVTELFPAAASGAVEGMGAGALTAFGAYGAVSIFGTAGTGAAITGLSGAAATNATLAWLGGGTLAAGGMGVAGGTMVLGGLVAGPALAIFGSVMNSKAEENLEKALKNRAKAEKFIEEMKLVEGRCINIGHRSGYFVKLLTELDEVFQPLINRLEKIVNSGRTDYRDYNDYEKKVVAMARATAGAVKAVLDTPILTEDGAVTTESWQTYREVEAALPRLHV